jgi:hypothetical protein
MIKVAVRVRPFLPDEIANTLCVDIPSETQLVIKDMEGNSDKTFEYNHCLWSFDGFDLSKQGTRKAKPGVDGYASQEDVWECLGRPALELAISGENANVVAYGYGDSGKSFSMFGHGSDKGLIPHACEEVFEWIDDSY